jgi:hypothetical protein
MRELRNGKGRPGKSRRGGAHCSCIAGRGSPLPARSRPRSARRRRARRRRRGVPRWTLRRRRFPRRRIWRVSRRRFPHRRVPWERLSRRRVPRRLRGLATASPAGTRATGTMAGVAGATAGCGPLPDWRGRTMIIRGGALIQIMTTTITVSLTPTKPGTIAPIRQAIIRM